MSERLDLVLDDVGWKLLNAFEPMGPDALDALGTQMRHKGIDGQRVAAVLTQLQLRFEARKKFDRFADQLILTRTGMEQASRLSVAALHAERFRNAGATHIADCGCGIGIDSLAMAGLGLHVTAIDIDEVALSAATVNLRFFDHADTLLADVTDLDIAQLGVDAIFADPARRDGKGRIHDPNRWSPPLSTVLSWADTVDGVGVKVSPAINYADVPPNAEVTWTSVDGQLVEACIWLGTVAPDGPGRSLIAIDSHGNTLTHRVTGVDDPSSPPDRVDPAPQVGPYIFEPDPAFIRAGAIHDVCRNLDARPIGPGMAYLTGQKLPDGDIASFIDVFEVVDHCSLSPKAITAMMRNYAVSRLDIKKRGVDVVPSQLRHRIFGGKKGIRLDPAGTDYTLICTPTVTKRTAFFTQRKIIPPVESA